MNKEFFLSFRNGLRTAFAMFAVLTLFFLSVPTTVIFAAEDEVIQFHDANLEKGVREWLKIPTPNPVTKSDMAKLYELSFENWGAHRSEEAEIVDITDLQYATGITRLFISGHRIKDLTPIKHLTHLRSLHIDQNVVPLDITPLAEMTWLNSLMLYVNGIRDISPLKNLTSLTHLNLMANQIEDISPLAELTNLEDLSLDMNQIRDLEPLRGLSKLWRVSLADNCIEDFRPVDSRVQCETRGQKYVRTITLSDLEQPYELKFISYNQLGQFPETFELEAKSSKGLEVKKQEGGFLVVWDQKTPLEVGKEYEIAFLDDGRARERFPKSGRHLYIKLVVHDQGFPFVSHDEEVERDQSLVSNPLTAADSFVKPVVPPVATVTKQSPVVEVETVNLNRVTVAQTGETRQDGRGFGLLILAACALTARRFLYRVKPNCITQM